jgi:hypothetical protein
MTQSLYAHMNKGNKTQNKTKQKNSVGLKKELAGFFFFFRAWVW